jgi:DNA-binding response OmpR family regulator
VLIVDSYDDARFPLVRYLDRFGFRVIEAGSADEAMQLLDLHHPDVVLSGLRAEQASRFYEELGERGGAAVPVLIALLSGLDDRVPALATGVLRKPFSLRPMLDELRRGLRVSARSDGPASAL